MIRKFILVMLFGAVVMASELVWLDEYDTALQRAKQEHKPLYVFISSSQCGWCHKFEKTTLQDESVKKRLAKEFITVHLVRDFDSVPKQFETSPVPRHYFVDEDGKILYNSLGYRKVAMFHAFMDNALQAYTLENKEK
jgi:thioredoxin-related protein